jgi:hypothetical protein
VQANRFIDSSYHSLKAKRSKTKTTEKQLEHKTEYLDSSSDDSVDEMQSMPSPRTPPQNRRSRKRVKTPNAPVKVKKTVAEAPTREAGTREATTKDLFRTIPLGFLTFAVAYGPHLCSLNANIFDAWSTELWQLWSNLDSTKRAMFEKSESQSTKKEP